MTLEQCKNGIRMVKKRLIKTKLRWISFPCNFKGFFIVSSHFPHVGSIWRADQDGNADMPGRLPRAGAVLLPADGGRAGRCRGKRLPRGGRLPRCRRKQTGNGPAQRYTSLQLGLLYVAFDPTAKISLLNDSTCTFGL